MISGTFSVLGDTLWGRCRYVTCTIRGCSLRSYPRLLCGDAFCVIGLNSGMFYSKINSPYEISTIPHIVQGNTLGKSKETKKREFFKNP